MIKHVLYYYVINFILVLCPSFIEYISSTRDCVTPTPKKRKYSGELTLYLKKASTWLDKKFRFYNSTFHMSQTWYLMNLNSKIVYLSEPGPSIFTGLGSQASGVYI